MQLLGLANKSSIVVRFEEGFKTMWAKNGDNISRIYIGTGALDGKARVSGKTYEMYGPDDRDPC